MAAEGYAAVILLDGNAMLYAPAPQTVYDESRPAERLFAPASPQPVPEQSVEERLVKELRFDPDAWIVETEDRAGRHFLDLARGDSTAAIRKLSAIPDTLCLADNGGNCFHLNLTLARLLAARGEDRAAGALLDRWRSKPVGINYAAFVGFGAVRRAEIGDSDRAPTAEELARMRARSAASRPTALPSSASSFASRLPVVMGSSSPTTTATGATSARLCTRASPVCNVLIIALTAPTFATASTVISNCGRFSRKIATQSPLPSPCASK